jgi:hypothetical protein
LTLRWQTPSNPTEERQMSRFNATDYQQNPGKYKAFKTAQIAENIVTHNGEHDLAEGTYVCIQYRCEAFNALYRRMEPVYTILSTQHGYVDLRRDLYANSLMNFVL